MCKKMYLLIAFIMIIFTGCTFGFKNNLDWNKTDSIDHYLADWKEINSNKKMTIKKINDKIEIIASKKEIFSAEFFTFNDITILALKLPSKRFIFMKVKLISNEKLILQHLDISILKKLFDISKVSKELFNNCKKELTSISTNESDTNLAKYSSLEDCLVLNSESDYLSELIKINHSTIFDKEDIFFMKVKEPI